MEGSVPTPAAAQPSPHQDPRVPADPTPATHALPPPVSPRAGADVGQVAREAERGGRAVGGGAAQAMERCALSLLRFAATNSPRAAGIGWDTPGTRDGSLSDDDGEGNGARRVGRDAARPAAPSIGARQAGGRAAKRASNDMAAALAAVALAAVRGANGGRGGARGEPGAAGRASRRRAPATGGGIGDEDGGDAAGSRQGGETERGRRAPGRGGGACGVSYVD